MPPPSSSPAHDGTHGNAALRSPSPPATLSLPLLGPVTPLEHVRLMQGAQLTGAGAVLGIMAGALASSREDYARVIARGGVGTTATERSANLARMGARGVASGAKYSGFVAAFVGVDLALARYRGQEDFWNRTAAGAVTGGTFLARGGAAAAIAGAVMGGGLAYIVSAGLDILETVERQMREPTLEELDTELALRRQEAASAESGTASAMLSAPPADETDRQIEHMEDLLKSWPAAANKAAADGAIVPSSDKR